MNIGSDSFETFRCDQAMQIGLNMTNLHKIFGAFTNGSCSITADGEDADTVQFVFESAKESSTAKKSKNEGERRERRRRRRVRRRKRKELRRRRNGRRRQKNQNHQSEKPPLQF